jgi:type I restriction enzyme S subunit
VPKLRFPEFRSTREWSETKLGTIAESINERAGENKYILMSVTSGLGLIPQKEKFGREIAGSQYNKYYVIRKWDFAYNKSATKQYPEGYIAMLKDIETAAVPYSIFTCFRIINKKILPQFLDYLFHDNFHGKWLRKFIEVGARAHGSLNVDTGILFKMPIVFPSLNEQQKIVDCLSSLDVLIAIQNQKLEVLKLHKKGLMQQLFPNIKDNSK